MQFMQDDRVIYVGEKYPELRAAVGFIVAPMGNESGVYVVDFSGDSYVMGYKSINPYKPSGEDKAPTVMPVRRRRSEDEE